MITFSSPAAAQVYGEYERRNAEEQVRAAALGKDLFAHRDEFLLPVGPEVGAFLHSLVLARRPARLLELGTSYGYSTLILADAARQVGAKLVTMELADYKQAEARRQIDRAGLADAVDFRLGDAVAMTRADSGAPFEFILLDIWKELYVPCLQAFYPKLAPEGIVAADNMVEPVYARDSARAYRQALGQLADLQTTLLPIGSGIELSVRWPAGHHKL